ncbi:MAG: hypothetical protein Q4D19_00125 [Lautropia sp.]|nr:hypothetical protein [Lautropia sp.]
MKNLLSRLILRRKPAYRPQAESRAIERLQENLADHRIDSGRRSLLYRTSALMVTPAAIGVGATVALDIFGSRATAAQIRQFPESTRVGRIRFGQFPEATLNGKAIRLGPGARIISQDNLLVTPGTLHGKSYVVGYITGPADEITTLWLLSDDEYRALRKKKS